MNGYKLDDVVIQNFAAVKKDDERFNHDEALKRQQHEMTDADVGLYKHFQDATRYLYNRFKLQKLTEEDFMNCLGQYKNDINQNCIRTAKCEQNVSRKLDDVLPIDIELDFQDGQIKLKRKGTLHHDKACCCNLDDETQRKEEQISKTNNTMEQLMRTFEQEKKKLLRQLEHDKEMILKKSNDKYERKLQTEKDFLGTVIADLVKSLEEARNQVERMQKLRQEERTKLKRYYQLKLAEEKKKLEIQLSQN